MGHTRPKITEEHIAQIQRLLDRNPEWNRSRLSVELCEIWEWKNPLGVAKDISCRDLLRELDKTGLIKLPPPHHRTRQPGTSADKIKLISHNTELVEADLSELMPIKIEIVSKKDDIIVFKSYIEKYHYLNYERSIGESMRYAVKSSNGTPLACMMFGAAAWKCKPRDGFIGWSDDTRIKGLYYITNNVRNLIFPWDHVAYCTSCCTLLGGLSA